MKLKSIKKTNAHRHIKMNDIKDCWRGRKILTPDGFTEIKDFFFTKRNKTIIIQTDMGTELRCDPNHKLMISRNGQEMEALAKNLNSLTDEVVGYGGTHRFIVDEGPEEDLYDISIDSPHWYYTSGILSHNSIVICNNAAACVKMGLKVLHVTCELSWFKTACRYLGIFSKVNIKERLKESNKEYILKALGKIKKSYGGDLVIQEFPPDMISIRTISSLIDSLKKSRGWSPDVIAVDYLELLLSENEYFNRDEYKRQKKVSTEIRQLAKTSGTFIITATQTNRGKEEGKNGESDLIDVNRVSESFGKMMPCVLPDTIILGDNNLPIQSCHPGIKVYGHDGVAVKVNKQMQRKYSGELITVKAMGCLPTSTTPEHPIYVYRNNTMQWVEAKNLIKRDRVALPTLETSSTQQIPVDPYPNGWHTANHIPCDIEFSNKFAEFLGYYVAEGHSDKQGHVRLDFGPHEIELVQHAASLCGVLFDSKISIHESRISFVHRPLARMLRKHFGTHATNKHMPSWLLQAPHDKLLAYLSAYRLGDGEHNSSQRISFATASKTLALQTQLALIRLGVFFNVSLRKGNGYGFGQITPNGQHGRHDLYIVYSGRNEAFDLFSQDRKSTTTNHIGQNKAILQDNGIWTVPIKSIQKSQYDGMVHNIATDSHSYLVNNIVVHNCDYVVSINQSRTEYGTHKVSKSKEVDVEELEELSQDEQNKEQNKEQKEESDNNISWRGMRLYIAKNRNGPKFKTVRTIVNFNTMFMKEITEGEIK